MTAEELERKLDRNERIIKTDYDNEVRNFHLGNFALVRGKIQRRSDIIRRH